MTTTGMEVLAPGGLAGATALVTGAGTGIGRAVSVRLAALGALVVGVGRRPEPLAGTGGGWDSVLDLNLTAVAALTLAAHPWLARRGGCVVNLSLSEPERGIPGLAHSAAARAGVLGLTRALAAAWRPDRISLTCLAPGTVLTDGVREELPEAALREVVRRTPLGRATRPEEVAELVAFLAGPAGAALSGQLVALDGGAGLTGAAALT